MIIRDATPADAQAAAAIRERTIRTIVAPLGLYSSQEIEAWTANFTVERVRLLIGRGNYLVAEDNDHVVGLGRLQMTALGVACIRGLFVEADFVGRGIGAMILGKLIARSAGLGVTDIEVVATLNARSFYERNGFRCLERVQHTTVSGAVIPGFHKRYEAPMRSAIPD